MNRTKLLNEFEMILSEYILVEDFLALENNNEDKDMVSNQSANCKCRRTCGRSNCADKVSRKAAMRNEQKF